MESARLQAVPELPAEARLPASVQGIPSVARGPGQCTSLLRSARAAVRSHAEPALPVPDAAAPRGAQHAALRAVGAARPDPAPRRRRHRQDDARAVGAGGRGARQRRSACVLDQPDADALGVLRVHRPRLPPERRAPRCRRRASSTEFQRDLQERHDAGGLTTLIIDEAQSLPYELLEEVRLLANIETSTVKLLNLVLVGQPELADRLNEQSLRQLKQRITLRAQLSRSTCAKRRPTSPAACASPAASRRDPHREAVVAIYETRTASRGSSTCSATTP